MKLVIGNKNYSSWSMRPWIMLRHFAVDFEEVLVPLFVDGYQDELKKYSPTQRVPVLLDGESTIWDSLAICEYISEKYLAGAALPEDMEMRAICRSYASEMHSGFLSIRNELPMNCRARREIALSAGVNSECQRIDAMWALARTECISGDYLFGDFSLADCMFAPIVMRFHSYAIPLSDLSKKYLQTMLENPAVLAWWNDAKTEPQMLPDYEVGEEITL